MYTLPGYGPIRHKLPLISLGIIGLFATLALAFFYITQSRAESLPNTGAPAGFTLTKVTDGLTLPTASQFSPDGRIFIAQKDGTVKIYKNGQLLAQPFYTVQNVNNYVDRGLLGLALDPNFATNGYVYLLFTYDNNPSNIAGPKTGRLLRVTAAGDTAQPGSERVILGTNVGNSVQTSCNDFPVTSDCLVADGLSHAPGSVLFGPDGKLYISVGDAASYDDVDINAFRAQDLNNLAGKVLRVNPDGSGVADNPYYTGNPNDNRSKVYASGLRNTFRLSVRPSDGLIMGGEVGWNTWEEVNVIGKGANLGWPCYEGNDQQNGTGAPGIGAYKDLPQCQQTYQNPPANLTFPIHFYEHPPSSAVVGGVFYTGDNYPASFKNRYFYGDYAKNQIYSLQLGATNGLVPGSNQTFASNAGGPVNFFTGPGGDIYYSAILEGGIYHIQYSTANQGPNAVMAADKLFGPAPLAVNFTSSGSSDPENDPLTYAWDFGDGSPISTAANPAHTFNANGSYLVKLTVTDSFNNVATKTLTIQAGQSAPVLTINSPIDLTTATVGQAINYSGSATDAQDGAISADKLRWKVVIQHCPLDSCHVHTVNEVIGANGTFPFPAHDGPFYVELTLSVTDSSGLTTNKSVSVYPAGQPIRHSINFDGINDYVTAANSADFRLQQFTAEAFVKTLSTDDYGSEVLSMGNNWMLRITPDGNLQTSFNSANVWQNLNTTTVNVKDGLWHHVALTRTANALKLYVDGMPVAQSENPNAINYTYGNTFTIGRHGDGDDHFNFNGAIDEVRIWSTPRTDAQIAQYRSTTLPTGQAGLLAYYTAEEANGVVSADKSPSASHGLTLLNGANWTTGVPLSDPVVTPATTPVSQLQDSFSGAAIDTAKWTAYQPAANNNIQNGRLAATPRTNLASYHGIISNTSYDLQSSSAFVEVPQTTSNSSAETQFTLELNAANAVTIGKTGTSLLLRHRVNGTNSDTYVAYNATAMRWWRIVEVGGSISLQTSPDRTTWTSHRSFAKAFDISQLKLILQAGTWQPVASPGVALFDNVNSAATAAPNTSLSLNGGATSQAGVNGGSQYLAAYQNLTVEAWVKAQATGIYGGEVLSNGNNYGLRVMSDGNVRFFVHTGNLIWKNYDTTTLNLKDNAWHHIAVTKDATSVKIYTDGVLRATLAAPETISYTLDRNIALGRNAAGDNNFNLTGSIDEVRIWNSARTAADIQTNRSVELVAQGNLTYYWRFNEGSGLTVADSSNGGHPLTLVAGAAWSAGFPRQ